MKEPAIFINHILDSIEDIEDYSRNISSNQFLQDKKLQDAIIRRIEIIGEAVKNIPDSFRKKHPKIPWKGIAGMRDKIIHHYFGLDLDTIWNVVKEEIPTLKKEIKNI